MSTGATLGVNDARYPSGAFYLKLAGARRHSAADGHHEILGADNLAHGRWGEQKLVVRLPHQQRPAAGSTLWLHLPLEHLHLFDGETGQRA